MIVIYFERKEDMKKIFALLLAAVMTFSLAACGGGDPQISNSDSAQNTESIENNPTSGDTSSDSDVDVNSEPIVSDEEMVGIWLSADNVSFEIKADGTVINKSRGQNITFTKDEQYVSWQVEGNNFIFQEAMGSILKFEIIKDNDLLKLKYLEMDGAFVFGIIVEEFMTELTKQADK